MRAVVALFSAFLISAVSILLVVAADSPTSEADKFHQDFLKQHSNNSQSLAPGIAKSNNPHVKPYGAIVQAARWPSPKIFVCWENPDSKYLDGMSWTKDAVEKTWKKESALSFNGWQPCALQNVGIRIQIDDSGPHVKELGRFLDRKEHGMVLNFTFGNWSSDCQSQLEYCIRAIAVHEFGHAIGFTHEQNRADAPGECRARRQGTDPDTFLTPYDPDSVMNYCNRKWSNDGFLSKQDIAAVRLLYGTGK